MSNRRTSDTSNIEDLIIRLEVIPEDEENVNIADIDDVGRSIFDQLTTHGFTVVPVPAGKKGGEPVFDILVQASHILVANKDWFLAMLDALPPILQCLIITRDKRAAKEKTKRSPLKISLQVDGKPVVIETEKLADAEELLKQLQVIHPGNTSQSSPKTDIKIQVSVPKKKRRGSRSL
jgi:hypothetical protein